MVNALHKIELQVTYFRQPKCRHETLYSRATSAHEHRLAVSRSINRSSKSGIGAIRRNSLWRPKSRGFAFPSDNSRSSSFFSNGRDSSNTRRCIEVRGWRGGGGGV